MCVIEWEAITVLEFAENGLALVYEMPHKVQRSMEGKSNAFKMFGDWPPGWRLGYFHISAVTLDK